MKPIIVMQTDFGIGGGSAMHGTCLKVDPEFEIYEANHSIEKFNVQAAGRNLRNLIPFWPEGTVFVSVVDPGVGTSRRACVALTANGRYVVTPDNGCLEEIREKHGIASVREIDQSVNRYKGNAWSLKSDIFHGSACFIHDDAVDAVASGRPDGAEDRQADDEEKTQAVIPVRHEKHSFISCLRVVLA